jgi:hypothetical protein
VAQRLKQDRQAQRWTDDRELLAAIEPGLHLLVDSVADWARITGTVRIPLPDGRVGSFEIAIEYPGSDPFEVPDTYDIVERFPAEPERHIEVDGRFCMWLPEEAPSREFEAEGGLALYLFRVQEFIALQLMYEVRRKLSVMPRWPGEDWSHGDAGHREWLEKVTAGLDADQLQALLVRVQVPGKASQRCPCGSGKRLGNCHKDWLKALRRVWSDPAVRRTTLYLLKERRETISTDSPSKD